jgi:hypothetical protein
MLPQSLWRQPVRISCQAMTRDIITACEDDIEELPDVTLLLDIYDSWLCAPISSCG